jgi:hypothetical protein
MAEAKKVDNSFINDFVNNGVEGAQGAQASEEIIEDAEVIEGAQGAQAAEVIEGAQGAQAAEVIEGAQAAEVIEGAQGNQAPDYELLYNHERQRNASWDGRIKAEAKRANELEVKLKEITDKVSKDTSLSLEELIATDPEIKKFVDEMGSDFTKPFLKMLNVTAKKIIDDAVKPIRETVEPLSQKITDKEVEDAATHYKTIQTKHPDVLKLLESKALDSWVEGLPFKTAIEKKRILTDGSTQEVIALLDEYKTSIKKSAPKPDTKVVNAATVVKTGPGVIPQGAVKTVGFEDTFEAITTQQ